MGKPLELHRRLRAALSLRGSIARVARASLGEQLVERYGAMVWAVARRHGLGLEDAADVSQVTWLLLTQHLGLLPQPDRLGL
jgi:DNA-directed RNA polymerase specialized sigma24 family protein